MSHGVGLDGKGRHVLQSRGMALGGRDETRQKHVLLFGGGGTNVCANMSDCIHNVLCQCVRVCVCERERLSTFRLGFSEAHFL